MTQREILILAEMIDAAEEAQRLVTGCDVAALTGDRQRRDALLWNFTVIGEAAGRLTTEFRNAHADVNWARPAQLRNRIVHGYWSIDLDIILNTALVDLPDYTDQLRAILEALEDPPGP